MTPEVTIDSLTDDNFSDTERRQRHKKKKRHHEKHSSHRHHERRDFRKLAAETEEGEDSKEEDEPTPKRLQLEDEDDEDSLHVRNLREKKTIEDDKTPLQLCLDYLHRILQRKDSNGFFAFPVTDNIAPGYSSIISHPMDFSSMKAKIDDGAYGSVAEFKNDYELMMNNCITYNHPDTVYHKEAKRLLSVGLRLMSREKLLHMKRGLPFMSGVSKEELGFDEETAAAADDGTAVADGSRSSKSKVKQKRPSGIGRFEAVPDDMTPEEILEQAQNAAQEAANQLMIQSPASKIGFLRRKEDGTTTLNILNPDDGGFISEKERVVSLGSLVGKLTSGSGSLMGVREDKRNRVSHVTYLNYGAFSSYAPVYDSASANISKEDSDLLLSTYADETGLQYAKSLRHFVADAGDYTIAMVDDLLNVLTSGEHSKVMALLEEREEKEKQEKQETETANEQMDATAMETDQPSAADCIKSRDELGTGESLLSGFEDEAQQLHLDEADQETEKKLNRTTDLILDLQQTQYERLSEKLPDHLAYVKDPSNDEISLANEVTKQLTELVKQVTPGDVVKLERVRSAMGIAVMAVSGDTSGNTLDTDTPSSSTSSSPQQVSIASPDVVTAGSGDENAKTVGEMSELEDDSLFLFEETIAAQENTLTENECVSGPTDSNHC